MKIDINKDFEQAFPEEAVKGFSLKQCVAGVLSLTIMIGGAFLLWRFTGLEPSMGALAAMPLACPAICLAFFEYQGHTPAEMIKEMTYVVKTKHLCYGAGEIPEGKERAFTMKREGSRRGEKAWQ